MHIKKHTLLALTTAVCLSATLTSSAAVALEPADQAKLEQAAAKLQAGSKAYGAGDYAAAIVLWKESVALQPTGAGYFNLAKAYNRKARQAKVLANRLDELQAGRRYALKANKQKPFPLSEEDLSKNAKLLAELDKRIAATKAEVEESMLVDRRVTTLTYVGAGVAGAGVAGLITSFVYNRRVRSIDTQLQDAVDTGDQDTYDSLQPDLAPAQRNGQVALAVGGALTLVGAGLLAWDLLTIERVMPQSSAEEDKDGAASRILFAPSVGPGHAGVFLHARF